MNDPQIPEGKILTRRKALSRLGIVALAAYTGPMVSTLSMAHAGSSASKPSKPSAPSKPSVSSGPSSSNGPSSSSADDGTSGADDSAFRACGPENLNDPAYVACLSKNGLPTP